MYRIVFAAAFCLMVSLAGTSGAAAVDFSNPAFAPSGAQTTIPIGHYEFCKAHPGDCVPRGAAVSAVTLTEKAWQGLIDVNNWANAAFAPVSDYEQYRVEERWTYPVDAADCEDYVLAKRQALIAAGWPASTLLIAVVQQQNGEGHAVLMVRTDRGDLVLDNQDGAIRLWNETPYSFVKRQSQQDPAQGVAITDDRAVLTASHR
jgi:predicted transglutaminase-like cysteine proteinase